ncbi:hypothetical protein [Mucilaginibacter ginkgonis]|uniref:Uncharacterized protein n=1 Tax=Mucilaginibacter ginkgonis TaxID=2682091 RepID=A0A6I4HUX0_9SPHI|nr:hypothetical protein [Mucilaginibacter ginkgonis]QQL50079.1 hypothetical protein GO620_001095 [Mucilaginibacter ginkgonis]
MKVSATIYRYLFFLLLMTIGPVVLTATGDTFLLIPKFWLLFGFISALTLMTIILILVVQQINRDLYAQAFLAATTVKILVCLFFVLFFLRKTPVNRHVFALDFCYVYFLNTAFEVYGLLRNLRNQNLR